MNSLRRWLYKPKKSDRSLLAQFYYADEELNMVAAELDSFDGHKDPERCTLLVNQLRGCQDKVLNIIQKIMDKAIDVDRANRDFRVKFPDDVLQESLAGQLWFGAECLAAGSTIMNREVESASMRPLARALTKNLDSLRSILREQCLKNINVYTERIKEALTIFDKLFAEFELSYVSAMVPVKTMKEYDILQEVTVLFSETVHRSLKLGLLTQEMIDDYDPALMFTIPRLAIVCGLLVYPEGPLNPDMETSNMSEMFRPFQPLLYKIRELLYTLSRDELFTLEKALCSADEPEIDLSSSLIHQSDMDSQSQVSCQTEKVASMDARFLTISPLTPALYQDSACQEDILVHSPSSGSPVTPDSEGEFSIGQMSHSPSVVTIILKGSPASDHRTVESVEISSLNKCASKDSGFSSENIGSSGSLSNPVSSCDDDDHHCSADCAMDTSSNSSSTSSNINNNNNIPNDRVAAAQASCGAELCETASLPVNPSYQSPPQLQQESHSLSYQHSSYPSSPSSTPSPTPSPKQVRHKQEACESPNKSTDILTTHHDITDRLVSQNLSLTPTFTSTPSSLSPQLPSPAEIPAVMTQSWQYDIQFEIPRISIQPSSSVEDIDAIHEAEQQQQQQKEQQQDVQQNSSSSPPSLSQQQQPPPQQQQQQQSIHKQVHSVHNPSHDHLLQECTESAATIRPSSHYLGSCRRNTEATSHAGGDLIKNKRKVCHSNRVTEPDCKGTLKFSTAMNACALEKFQHKAGNPYRRGSSGGGGSVSHGAMLPDDSEACLEIPRIQRLRYTESISSTCSSCRSGCSVGSDCEWDRESCASSETSSYNSDCHDDEEIALAIQAAELASRNEARSRFQNSSDLIHRLFVCISGVADQLQTNFASDLRSILKAVFDINCSEPLVMADNAIESGSQLYTAGSNHAMGSVGVPHHIAASGSTGSPSPPLLARSASSDDDQHLEQYARSRSFQEPPPWVPDEQCPHCSSCKAPFTFVKRRHHCRNCGKVFCSRCSANSVPLPQYGHVKAVRVCNHCFVFQVTHFTVQEE